MSDSYLEQLNAFIQGLAAPVPASVDKEQAAVPISTASTLSKSEEAARKATLDAASPMLAMPLVMPANFHQLFVEPELIEGVAGVSISALERGVEEAKNKIIMGMLDAWLDSIKKDALRREEELNSLAYKNWLAAQSPSIKQEQEGERISEKTKVAIMTSAEYQAWIASLMSPPVAMPAEAGPAEALRIGIVNGLDNYLRSVRGNTDPAVTVALPFMAASFVLGVSALGTEYALVGAGAQAEIVLQQGIHRLYNLVPSDARAELGLIGALFSVGLVYQATIESIMFPGKGEKPKGMAFARNYVRNVMKMITGEGADAFIRNLLGDKMDEKRKDGILASMKLILLATALGVVYKIETGGISGKEFAALLSGKMELPKNDLKADLVGYIKIQLSMLSKTEQENLLSSLIGFMDDDHNLDFMLNPSHVFERVLSDFNSGGPVHQPV